MFVLPEAAKKIIRIKPSEFAESVFTLDGRPFRLGARRYLLPIYDLDIPEGIIMSGRQVEKSTTNATKIGTCTLMEKNFKALYVAPLNEQVKEFSRERIGKFYEYSRNDIVNKLYRNKRVDVNNVSMKQFSKVNSINYFRHCYGTGDNIRGITANGLWFDELQDILVDAVPVVKECQAHALDTGSRTRVTWYTGTPKTFSNTIQQKFNESTQNEWMIRCPHCGQYQILGLKNLTPDKFICRKCKKELQKDIFRDGKWIPMQRNKSIVGFRISQMMVPWITPQDLWAKYKSYSKAKFFNEVLGRSYEDASKPFNILQLNAISDNQYRLSEILPPEFYNRKIYMGVDWGTGGKSYTVMTIFSYNRAGEFQLLFAKKFEAVEETEPDYQVEYISKMMNAFKVNLAVLDWGFGFMQNRTLQKRFGTRVAICYYSFNQNKKIKYNADKQFYCVNRTKVISEYVECIQKKYIVWTGADKDKIEFLFDNHLCELAEYRKSQNGRSEELMYFHPESEPDDGLHSCVYAKLAAELDSNNPDKSISQEVPSFSGFYDNSGFDDPFLC